MSDKPEQERFEVTMLTVTAVAQRLGVDPRTVRRWDDQGLFPGSRRVSPVPRSPRRIPETAVIEFEKKRVQT